MIASYHTAVLFDAKYVGFSSAERGGKSQKTKKRARKNKKAGDSDSDFDPSPDEDNVRGPSVFGSPS
jgi:hypothetical protein